MNRRTAFLSLAVLSLFVFAFPQATFAQSGSMIGTWKLNVEKSKYPAGMTPRSQTNIYQQDGQNIKGTVQQVDAQGNATTTVLMHIYDGQSHPVTGNPNYDARSYTRVDANTLVSATTKGGKLVQVATIVVSQDGKTFTTTTTGILNAAGQAGTTVAVYDKQ
jgi:hypothetical protein